MAKILYGSMVTDITGSIGGLTFQRNLSGNICRLRPQQSRTVNEAQVERTIYFSQAVASYKFLTTSQKNLWKAFAAAHSKVNYYGEEKVLSAQNWYTSLYLNAVSIGVAPLSTPPTYSVPSPYPDVEEPVLDTGTQELILYPTLPFDLTNKSLLIYASPLTFNNSLLDRSNLYYLTQISNTMPEEINLFTSYSELFFEQATFEVTAGFPVFIKLALVIMSRTSMLCSQAVICLASNVA